MSKNQNQNLGRKFIPAQLYTSPQDWFVYYSCIDPRTNVLRRKKIKINRIKNIPERKRYARWLIEEVNDKLYSGWNPFLEDECSNGMTLLTGAIKKFIRRKEKELRSGSMRSYYSYTDIFEKWLTENELHEVFAVNFSTHNAIEFMNWVYDVKDVGGTTYNNYRAFFKLFWNWLIANNYANTNVFQKIQKKKEKPKERTIIPDRDRKRIAAYFRDNDYNMYMACLLVYHTLIRPGELTYITPQSFNLENQTITIQSSAAKAAKVRVTTIPDSFIDLVRKWEYAGAMDDQFIFGKNFEPSRLKLDPKRFGKKWAAMRTKLEMPKQYQMYSLRDTGIVELLKNGVSPDEVMKQAGHHSLEITTIYARHFNNKGSDEIKGKAGEF